MDEFTQDIPIEQLLEMYSGTVYRLAYSRTGNKQDAEDITQDVFMKYIKSDIRFQDEEHRKAWLLKVTVNTVKNLLTSAWFRHRGDASELEKLEEDVAELPEEKSEVYYAVMKLPLKYRTVVHLFYYEEYSIKEISGILDKNESTVKSLLHRSRKMLKSLLKEDIYEF
ncbi:MAG: sigma-70 family RNA polymerase sigma factor [Lachnospiraceae bacterium]|nr:sigma-70 family RNA polymerase sigma factor [Lachnospiraceae bacterium]